MLFSQEYERILSHVHPLYIRKKQGHPERTGNDSIPAAEIVQSVFPMRMKMESVSASAVVGFLRIISSLVVIHFRFCFLQKALHVDSFPIMY